ncbi:TIGR03943 family putative permease subunit [Microbacterium sp. MC2]
MRENPVLPSLVTRLLGVGLAAAIAAVTVTLAVQDRLGLYINPESSWFAVSMSVLLLIGAVATFALPLGAEADHGHDHAHAHDHDHDHDHDHARPGVGAVATISGGVLATGVVGVMLLVPPATLSADIAISRDTGTPPLFQGADTVALAATGDTASFGVGEWASVFATATNPEAFDGDEIVLTGFVTPGEEGFDLTRLVVTHCVIDAQPARIPVATGEVPATGEWVTVTGTIRDVDGRLQIADAHVEQIAAPADPYEY